MPVTARGNPNLSTSSGRFDVKRVRVDLPPVATGARRNCRRLRGVGSGPTGWTAAAVDLDHGK